MKGWLLLITWLFSSMAFSYLFITFTTAQPDVGAWGFGRWLFFILLIPVFVLIHAHREGQRRKKKALEDRDEN
jgi:hypothetical protein